LHCHEKAVKET